MNNNTNRKSEFKRGFKQNSFLAIVIAVVLFTAVIFGLENYIDNGGILKTPNMFLSRATDNYGMSSYYVYKDRAITEDVNRIYYFGGSSAYYMLDYEQFSEEIKTELGEDYIFAPFALQQETTADILLMVENLPDGDSVVIMNTYFRKIYEQTENTKYYLKSTSEGYYLNGQEVLKAGNYDYASNLVFRRVLDRAFLSKTVGAIFKTIDMDTVYGYDYNIKRKRVSDKSFDSRITKIRDMLDNDVSSYIDEYERLISDIALMCEEKGFTLIIMDGTLNVAGIGEEYVYADKSLYTEYDRVMNNVVEKHDNTYRSYITCEYNYEDEMYRDEIHLIDMDAVHDLTSKLVMEIKQIIE